MMAETIDRQMADSDLIFRAISTAGYRSYEEAERAVMLLYATDLSWSRSGISHACRRLERFFADKGSDDDAQ